MSYDYTANSWRLADKFLELSQARRGELAAAIEKEMRDLAEMTVQQVIKECETKYNAR